MSVTLSHSHATESAILVHVYFDTAGEDLDEFQELVASAGASTLALVTTKRREPNAKYFVGSGKAEEIKDLVAEHKASLVIFNHNLSPAQERNLETVVQCRVLGRTGLILDIFAQRARTFEGKLQVELAQLKHLSTRLVRGWTHLERQKGGIGLRGPGETQLETDRRLVRGRMRMLNQRLDKVRQQRGQGRRARKRAALSTISLVGYTNTGKSTLFNNLTGADIYAANQLFATLDPTFRRIDLVGGKQGILADTVGFVSHLPHDLVAAFHATLEETREAALLLHVIDASNPKRREQRTEVLNVLKEIGADEIPLLEVYNKIDLVEDEEARVEYNEAGLPCRVYLSAMQNVGIDLLLSSIVDIIYGGAELREVCIAPSRGQLRAQLYERNVVEAEQIDDAGNWILSVRLAKADFAKLFTVDELR